MSTQGDKDHFTSHLTERYDIVRTFSSLPTGVIVSWVGKTKTGELVLLRYYPAEAEINSERFFGRGLDGWARIREVIPGQNKSLLIRDWVNGLSLSELLMRRETRPQEQEARQLFAAICAALGPLDETGDVHGALKPTNIFLREDKSIILTDPLLTEAGIYPPDMSIDIFQRTLLPYLSPEHLGGKRVTTASDVYSLGCIMYEWLTGKHLFETDAIGLMCERHFIETPPGIRSIRAEISAELEAIISRSLHKEPSSRFKTWKNLKEALGTSTTYYPGKISATTESSMVLSPAGTQTDEQRGEGVSHKQSEQTQTWETMRLSQKAIQEALELAKGEKSEFETHDTSTVQTREPDKDIRGVGHKIDTRVKIKYAGSSREPQKKEQSTSQNFMWLLIIIEALMIIFLSLLMMNKPG